MLTRANAPTGTFALAIRAAVATSKPQNLLWRDTNDELGEADLVARGGGFSASMRLLDVQSLVVRKVFDLIYAFAAHVASHDMNAANWWDRCEDVCIDFKSDEVLDVILIARRFDLIWLLKLLEEQGHFAEFGCALWEAARHIWKKLPGVAYIAQVQAAVTPAEFQCFLEALQSFKESHSNDKEEFKASVLEIFGGKGALKWDDAALETAAEYTGEEEAFSLVQSWLGKILGNGDEHFSPAVFMRDGAHFLTAEGFKVLLHSHELNTRRVPSTPKCGEYMVFEAVMMWCRTQYRRVMLRVKEENDKIEMQKQSQIPSLAMFGVNMQRLKAKKFALDKFALGAWQDVARSLLWLVRYPFIAPELLEFIQLDPDFQTVSMTDDKGRSLIMRAITHQHSSASRVSKELRECGLWHWEAPRVGSTIYTGEWEWVYGPATFKHGFKYVDEVTKEEVPAFESYQGARKVPAGKPRLSDLSLRVCAQQLAHEPENLEHPTWDQYLVTNFPFATPQEVKGLGLAKVEIKNLDLDGDGTPSVDDMLVTFRYCMPKPGGESRYLEMRIDSIAHLPKKDHMLMGGKCDPYAVLEYEKQVFKTSVKPNTLEATWDEVFVFQVSVGSEQKLKITFFDSDRFGKDEVIGQYIVPRARIREMVSEQKSGAILLCLVPY